MQNKLYRDMEMGNLPFGKQGMLLIMLLIGLMGLGAIGIFSFTLFPWDTLYSSWPWNLFPSK